MYIPEFDVKICKRITDRLSVFTAEITALILALQWIEEVRPGRVVICSDSIEALQSLNSNETIKDDLVMEMFTIMWRVELGLVCIFVGFLPTGMLKAMKKQTMFPKEN